jgi:predicted amidohydrolase YtcJ
LDEADPGQALWPEEKATLAQMIESFTINGATANFLEQTTGSISVGKMADLIVLDKNLFRIPAGEISKAKVLLTLFQGQKAAIDSSFQY